MFDFLKRLKKTGETPRALTVGEIATLLADEKARAQEAMRAGVLAHRAAILQGQEGIRAILPAFSPPREPPETHPKLRSITEHSLPLFVKAMEAAVARPIPEDPDGCYREGSEVLRSCLRTMKGQGRYLVTTHRQEMEQVREEVSRMGKAVNAMTEVIATARRRMAEIEGVEAPFRELTGARDDARNTSERIRDLEASETALVKEAGEVTRSRDLLEAGEEFRSVKDLSRRISLRESERDDTLREYQSLAAQAIHLFRKAEGSALSVQDSKGSDLFRAAREYLDMVPPPAAGQMRGILAPAVQRAQELEKTGVLVLKAADDRSLILGDPGLSERISPLLDRYHGLTQEIGDLHRTREAIPALASHRALHDRLRTLEKEQSVHTTQLKDLRAHQVIRERDLAPLREKLAAALTKLLGSPILVQE
ncbi:MAG: hypothetical protein LUP93_07690 [Methanomicrobiales archaeon]|nr:hypothetical protein [Methanomicrobia archaeon]MDD1646163.1 hypothetical protein [Methanomicrobiales archaeon]